jgi:two-component system response regulator RegA
MEPRPTLLIVEDDLSFSRALRKSFERRGYDVSVCGRTEEVDALAEAASPKFAIVDLKLGGASGLACVKALHQQDPATKIVVLTSFASITTAVEAIKLGACHYLAKPSNTDDIEAAFRKAKGDSTVPVTVRRTSIKNLEWERIHETLVDTEFNVSETARRLGMHRRTLARKLAKRRLT